MPSYLLQAESTTRVRRITTARKAHWKDQRRRRHRRPVPLPLCLGTNGKTKHRTKRRKPLSYRLLRTERDIRNCMSLPKMRRISCDCICVSVSSHYSTPPSGMWRWQSIITEATDVAEQVRKPAISPLLSRMRQAVSSYFRLSYSETA